FEDASPLGRLRRGERVARIEEGIAQDDIHFSVIRLRSRLCENLDTTAAWPRVLGRVRILVDANLRDGRRADIEAVHFHPIDDDRDTRVAKGPGIETSRDRREVITNEDGP